MVCLVSVCVGRWPGVQQQQQQERRQQRQPGEGAAANSARCLPCRAAGRCSKQMRPTPTDDVQLSMAINSQVPELLKGVYNIAHGLHSAADSALASQGVAADEPPADSPLAALKAAQTQLSTVLQLGAVEVEETAALLQDLVLPLCHELAVALQAWWQLHEQQAELQLAAAQAAARRSCAYLGCANLGGEGGPAAGEGVGSMRCR